MAEDDLRFTIQARGGVDTGASPAACWSACLPAEIKALLWAQRHAAQQLPYRLPEAREPSLDTVHVRQNLGVGVDEPEQSLQARQTPVDEGERHLLDMPAPPLVRITVRPPSRSMRDALDSDAHLLVTGGPGQGKSTLSLRLAADIAEHWTSRDGDPPLSEPVVPLRLTARSLAARLDMPFARALAAGISADYGPLLGAPVSVEALAERVAGCRWLLIVDALDEVADAERRIRLAGALAAWASASTYRVLLTTRPIEGGALAPLHRIGAIRYELQPFDEEALKRFAHNWFSRDDADRFLRQIREAHLSELVQVPLLATIAAIIFEHTGQPLPASQFSLYETYLARIRSGPGSPFDEHREPLLEHLARTRLESDASLLVAARAWVAERVELDDLSWRDELTTFLVSVGPFVMKSNDLAFLHHSFAEHLAATSLARELPPEFDEDSFDSTLRAARPRESGWIARRVLLHHARLNPGQGDRLLRWLHAGDVEQHLLAARLLCHHLPASADVVESFLATAWGWAMTTQYTAGQILAKTTRATHHPGLVSWLVRLMRNEGAPMRSRAEAATALAVRVRGQATTEAVEFLNLVVDERLASVQDRLVAAEGLAQCGAAERGAAERALRAVLADRHASGATCRAAAVVLSALDDAARVFAVDALSALMSDADTRVTDLVEVANGLLEIGVEYHPQCAETFLSVLRNPADTPAGVREAAMGLASLSADHLAAAAAALTSLINDRTRSIAVRGNAVGALGELGPTHRRTAGELILAELDASQSLNEVQVVLASRLSCLGSSFRNEAVAHLRALLNDPAQVEHHLQQIVMALADLGPDLRVEAAEQIVDRGLRTSHSRVTVLERLERLGEPYRSIALEELCSLVADAGVPNKVRCRAARHLITSAPELHDHAMSHLVDIASCHPDSEAVWTAWRDLGGTSLQDRALVELLDLCRGGQFAGFAFMLGELASAADVESIETSGRVLIENMGNSALPMRERLTSAVGLFSLSRAYDLAAAEGLASLVRSDEVTIWDFEYLAMFTAWRGRRAIRVLSEALSDVIRDPRTTTARAWQAVQAMDLLGLHDEPEVLQALDLILGDACLDRQVRADAALAAARYDRSQCARAIAIVTRACGVMFRADLHTAVRDLGTGLVREFEFVLADPDAYRARRCGSALALHDSSELRRQLADDYLDALGRLLLLHSWASIDRAGLPTAADELKSTMRDHEIPVAVRARAARELAILDRRSVTEAATSLRQIAENPHLHPDDRASAATWLRPMANESDWYSTALLAIVRHPALSPVSCAELVSSQPRWLRTEIERILLDDTVAEVSLRVPKADVWDDLPLRSESVAVVRDVITAPESRTRDRVLAAVALAQLNWSLIPEAIAVLGQFETAEARLGLARLGRRQQVCAEAMLVVEDETQPWRRRFAAALLIDEISDEPCARGLEVMRAARSWRQRVKAWAVAEDLAALRALRDDPQAVPAARRKAAVVLTDRRIEDRAAAARVLEEIAADGEIHPRMRWRAAADLGALGVRGRERALVVLERLARDEALPVGTRAKAACTWCELKPTAKREVLAVLAGMVPRSLEVLRATAVVDFARPLTELYEMAARETSPVARMWCARAMVELRRDQREKAAAIARAVAWDETVPTHVRRRAAADLARWSELMREDARALLLRLRGKCAE